MNSILRKNILLTALLTLGVAAYAQMAVRPGAGIPQRRAVPVKGTLPTSVDNTKSPYFPPIVSQYGGSCAQAAGIRYLFTYEMNRYLERPVNEIRNNIFSYRWTWNFLNGGTGDGGWSSDGIDITKIAGCMNAADYGQSEDESYYRWPSGYNKYYRAMHYKTVNDYTIDLKTSQGIEQMKAYMYDKNDGHPGGGIACFSISTDNWGYKSYDGPSELGIEDIITLDGDGGAHAMTLVGYDMSVEYDCNRNGVIDDTEKGAFLLVNSWGTWWGTEGCAYIPFYYFLTLESEGGIAQYDADALCIDVAYCEPQITIQLEVYHSSRNDLALQLSAADGAQAKSGASGTLLTYPLVKGQGGDFFMQGTPFASGQYMDIGMDYTSKIAAIDTMKAPCYILNVASTVRGKAGSGWVKAVTVHDYRSGNDVTYRKEYTEEEGHITIGSNRFYIPTRPWFKNASGRWYVEDVTSASPLSSTCWTTTKKKNRYSIRTADGNYATMMVYGHDEEKGILKVKFTYYEE